MKDTKHASQSAAIEKLTQSQVADLRTAAISAIIENGGVEQVRLNMAWLFDRSKDVRYRATRCLADSGDSRDLPALRHATDDSDEFVRLWGLRGVDRFKAPDIDAILRRTLRKHPSEDESRFDLAERGDPEQLHWCVNALTHFAEVSRRGSKPARARIDTSLVSEMDLQQIGRIIVRHRPDGTRAALSKIAGLTSRYYTGGAGLQCVGYGGLAALGDPAALARVRALTADPDPFAAINAIEWLGIANDQASALLLRKLLMNREVLVRDAARKSLSALKIAEVEKAVPPSFRVAAGNRTVPRSRVSLIWLVPVAVLSLALIGIKIVHSNQR